MNEHSKRESATPGPWEVSSGAVWATSPWNARVVIANVTTFSPMNGIDSAANARLIAAAPDLLDIIETIELGLKREYTPAELLDENSPIRDRIRAAITRATSSN